MTRVQVIPNARFIERSLCSQKPPHNTLNAYMIRQRALWLTTSNQIDSWRWEMALEVHKRFGADVAVHIAKVCIK
jgi:hypothetical protein